MKLRMEEPEEFAACAGAGVQGLVPDLADFWRRYLVAACDRGEIHQCVPRGPAASAVGGIGASAAWRPILSLLTGSFLFRVGLARRAASGDAPQRRI